MNPHLLMAAQTNQAAEYLIALSFLLLFIPFWRWVTGTAAVPLRVAEAAAGRHVDLLDWFVVPAKLHFHPGHAWVAVKEGNVVRVGVDDFAQKLLGTLAGVSLPEIGARIGQSAPGWSLTCDGRAIGMLAPVGGTVTAVNDRALAAPELVNHSPYDEGWLLEVRAPRLAADLRRLRQGAAARRWMAEVSEGLHDLTSRDLGRLAQDGGTPVRGIAKTLSPEAWDELARAFLLT